MNMAINSVLVAGVLLIGGCSSLERSRDLGNPEISATTIAQQVCSNCHGMTGVSPSPNFPSLAAQTEPYLIAQLTAFKNHQRSDPAGFEYMWGLSRSLTEAQIQGLAAYYSGQDAAAPRPVAGAAAAEAGRTIVENGLPDKGVPACTSCHGAHLEGAGPFPRLAGQHADYLAKQLLVFQRTDERPEGSVMKTVAHELTGRDIDGISAYLQGLPDARP